MVVPYDAHSAGFQHCAVPFARKIAPARFTVVEDWLTERRRAWEARFDRFDEYVKQLKEKESQS